MLLIELWADKKTSLIRWNKGWYWYHTFFQFYYEVPCNENINRCSKEIREA